MGARPVAGRTREGSGVYTAIACLKLFASLKLACVSEGLKTEAYFCKRVMAWGTHPGSPQLQSPAHTDSSAGAFPGNDFCPAPERLLNRLLPANKPLAAFPLCTWLPGWSLLSAFRQYSFLHGQEPISLISTEQAPLFFTQPASQPGWGRGVRPWHQDCAGA